MTADVHNSVLLARLLAVKLREFPGQEFEATPDGWSVGVSLAWLAADSLEQLAMLVEASDA